MLTQSLTLGFLLLVSLLPGLASGRNSSQFLNPILPGFHPDPSCTFISDEETFYCASSSFNAFPGIPIHASKDLTTWRLLGNVLNRESQLPELAASVGGTSGIWAPTLRLRDGTWYLVTTMVQDKKAADDPTRWRNIIFTTQDIWNESSWSDAVHFDFEGYDTSPFWDDDGTSYIVGSHAYKVEPGNHLAKVNLTTGELQSNWTNLWAGTGGLAPEGPHLYRKDGYYYLMIAEGGTGLGHMETIARSKNLYGPYEPNPANPILTNANTTEYFQTIGHADLFQDAHGKWWSVALSTRGGPAFKVYPMGRETILTNATWEEGAWPVIHNPVRGAMTGWPLPETGHHLPGNGPLVDQGDDDLQFPPGCQLPPYLLHWRPPVKQNYIISPPGHRGYLGLKPSKLNLTGIDGNSAPGGQTFVGRRQVDTLFTYRVVLDYNPKEAQEEAGVTLFLTQNHHVRLGLTLLAASNTSSTLTPHFRFTTEPYSSAAPPFSVPVPNALQNTRLAMEIKAANKTHFSFAVARADRKDLTVLAHAPGEIVSWGFTGTLVGVYATSNGGNGTEIAYVTNWRYKGEGQIRSNSSSATRL
ncbi:glycoside hydrolase family 43 protein [Karstenula rhodostoma CBS 690.94]|uniref:Glycoside hydrolase family 43 protein n=1 Tax=Karstenula rhodostoma CBS 690.94 TaxID=1392251 RepID=A0A9P4UHH2_9PLEO|nr:glycoside hydrolase family 43 protein [Karstenula rhodostoma CBS 690.94]